MRRSWNKVANVVAWLLIILVAEIAGTCPALGVTQPQRSEDGCSRGRSRPGDLAEKESITDIVPAKEVLERAFSAQDAEAFRQPSKVFYPETWFHFIGGNVSPEGIDADLQAIADARISGVQWFHGHFGGPWPATERQVRALTPEWEELVAHLARKADSLGLRLTIQTCPGWAMAGGPWITPENAQRRLVWSRTDLSGSRHVRMTLPQGDPSAEAWRDYRDICVLAFPTPLGDTGRPLQPQEIQCDEKGWDALLEASATALEPGLKDGSAEGKTPAEAPVDLAAGTTRSVRFTLPEGAVIRTLQLPNAGNICYNYVYNPLIHVSLTATLKDGGERTLVDTDLPYAAWQHGDGDVYLACHEVHDAVSYTFTFSNGYPSTLRFVRFWSAARKNNWRGEAGWALSAKELRQEHTKQDPHAFVRAADILDLSAFVKQGELDWEAPEGAWTVLRVGHVNAGRRNSPAPPEATGWECNKLDPHGAEVQFSHYVGALQDGPLDGRADGMLMDSWECQTQTWTAAMEDEFGAAAGYALRSFIPALMGYVIDDPETTSRFLIDWRRTLSQLYGEHFFRRMTDLAHEKGMRVQYETAGGDVVVMDPMEYHKYADVPMCEFWQPLMEGYVGDLDFKPIRPTASAAHLYGKPRVAAESFTSFNLTWDEHWGMLREVANLNFSEGVTHNVFHTYTHNPQVGFLPPGTSFGSNIGTPFLRGQTWWKYMPWFTDCLARTSFLLERGRPVKDILWYLGDEVGHRPQQYTGNGKRQTGPWRIPEGFDYDYCNPDILLHRLSVADGRLCTPEGISYSVLWIPENERMLPETVEKLGELIRAGARVIASAPVAPATLSEGASERLDAAIKDVWGSATQVGVRRLGDGKLAVGMTLEEALDAFRLQPQLLSDDPDLLWTGRETAGARWFFIAAPVGGEYHGTIRLQAGRKRSAGRLRAQWWDPVDGSIRTLPLRRRGRYVKIHLDLAQAESGFVVLRRDAADGAEMKPSAAKMAVNAPDGTKKAPSAARKFRHKEPVTDWTVRFPEGWGAPAGAVALPELKAWKDLDLGEEGRAFSGTALYETSFDLPENLRSKSVILDLGTVDFIAEVKVNGQSAGVRWSEPYRLDISEFVHPGTNTLTVSVTGTWYNRLAYDASLPEASRKTWTIHGPAAGSPLRPSGLLGPVSVSY